MKAVLPLAFILSAAIFLSGCNMVYASQKTIEEEIGQSRIHPASFFYFLKMFQEDLELNAAKTDSAKAARFLEFATRRIREVRSLVAVHREDMIEPTLERYWTHLQDLLGWFNRSDLRRDSEISQQVYEQLYILNAIYPHLTNNRARLAIRRTIYRISNWDADFADRIFKSNVDLNNVIVNNVYQHQQMACDFLVKVASDSALNDVDRYVFTQRANSCQREYLALPTT